MKELSTGASCNRDAEKLAKEIEKALAKKEKIIIDFEGIERYATLFFNFSLLFMYNALKVLYNLKREKTLWGK